MKLLAKTHEERDQTAAGLESDLRRCLTAWETRREIDDLQLGEFVASQKDREFREQQELLTQAAKKTDQLSEVLYKKRRGQVFPTAGHPKKILLIRNPPWCKPTPPTFC